MHLSQVLTFTHCRHIHHLVSMCLCRCNKWGRRVAAGRQAELAAEHGERAGGVHPMVIMSWKSTFMVPRLCAGAISARYSGATCTGASLHLSRRAKSLAP